MKIIRDLLECDALNVLPFNDISFDFDNPHCETVHKIRTLKNGGKVSINLKEAKHYQNKMDEWIVEHLDYPFEKKDMPKFYQALIKTFTSSQDHQLIDFLIASYPVHIKKMLDYEANKHYCYVDHPLLNQLRGKEREVQDVVSKEAKETKAPSTPTQTKLEKSASKSETSHFSKRAEKVERDGEKVEKEELKEMQEVFLKFVNEKVEKVKENAIQQYGKPVNEITDDLLKPYIQHFMANIREVNIRLRDGHNLTEHEIFNKILLPSLKDFKQEAFLLWQVKDEEKLVVGTETLGNGLFWSRIKDLPHDHFKWLPNIIKLSDYNQEEKFMLVFNTLAMITADEEKFRDRIKFFEQLGFSVVNTSAYAYSEKQEVVIYGKTRERLQAVAVSENNLKTSRNLDKKHLFNNETVSSLLQKENNLVWHKVLTELEITKANEANNKHRLNLEHFVK